MTDINVSREVLVIGAGPAGMAVSEKIAGQDYPVTHIPFGRETAPYRAAIERLTGTTGDFTADIFKDGKRETRRFGAVVAAPDYTREPLHKIYGLNLSEKVITQTRCEEILGDPSQTGKLVNGHGASVAFLSDYGKASSPENFERILTAAQKIQDLENCSAYIVVNNAKVGARGLEKRFTQGRHQGILCFKPEKMPEVQQSENELSIAFLDPVVQKEVSFSPDYIVIEECPQPDEQSDALKSILGIDTDLEGFLQSNNVHRFPVETNRTVIYVAHTPADADNIVLRIKELLGDGTVRAEADRAVVDPEKCVLCLTCYRCCPHGAIYWNDEAAVISPLACQGCGVCASECPMDAIQIKNFVDDSLRETVDTAVDSDKAVVVFCCENSALQAYKGARRLGMTLPENVRIIHVPCAGKVDVEFVWQALVKGASGVVIAACHDGNCKSEKGNTYAKWRSADISRRLEAIGISPEKVGFIRIASNMADDFTKSLAAFTENL